VVEDRRQRDHAEVHDVLPQERRLRVIRRPEAAHADVPHRQRERHTGERVVAAMTAVARERAAQQEQVQRQGEEREKLVNDHQAAFQNPR
jgi:hypothetical protein